ncbi:MAG: dihydrolipoyllysine-residue succinyltransferase [Verrucomicrobiota bacterium]|jgi:2-oxoglutarate dehydrogenase E2 component (dihydrolipoamide succinyltransferase)
MSHEVKIPSVGESISSGQLSVWHKADGESVAVGDALLTLDTDKVSTELTAEAAGILRIKAQAGEEVQIGQVVAVIEGAGVAAAPSAAPVAAVVAPSTAAPSPETVPPPVAPPKGVEVVAAPASSGGGTSLREAVAAANDSLGILKSGGSGIQPVVEGRMTRKKMTPLRRKIAAQLVMAQHQAAILTTFNECDLSAVMRLRSEMQEAFTKEFGVKLGFMSFFIKAVVSALQAVPSINARIEGEDLIQNHYFDIGVAVGTEKGLMVPVVRDADQKGFAQLEKELADYAIKAREGKIGLQDLQGGVFTISNGGVYGSLLSTPILNPPQSGILGMHKIQERPVAIKGQVVVRPMMYLALSYDHRVVDGKEAVTFLVRVKDCLENPMRLMLGL